jgi:5-methylcytosine-specific restriction endonuclease McrA
VSTLHQGGHRLVRTRIRIVDRDGAVCRRCGKAIDLRLSGLHPDGLTIGHVIAVDDGGSDADDNLAPEHRRCNGAIGRTH